MPIQHLWSLFLFQERLQRPFLLLRDPTGRASSGCSSLHHQVPRSIVDALVGASEVISGGTRNTDGSAWVTTANFLFETFLCHQSRSERLACLGVQLVGALLRRYRNAALESNNNRSMFNMYVGHHLLLNAHRTTPHSEQPHCRTAAPPYCPPITRNRYAIGSIPSLGTSVSAAIPGSTKKNSAGGTGGRGRAFSASDTRAAMPAQPYHPHGARVTAPPGGLSGSYSSGGSGYSSKGSGFSSSSYDGSSSAGGGGGGGGGGRVGGGGGGSDAGVVVDFQASDPLVGFADAGFTDWTMRGGPLCMCRTLLERIPAVSNNTFGALFELAVLSDQLLLDLEQAPKGNDWALLPPLIPTPATDPHLPDPLGLGGPITGPSAAEVQKAVAEDYPMLASTAFASTSLHTRLAERILRLVRFPSTNPTAFPLDPSLITDLPTACTARARRGHRGWWQTSRLRCSLASQADSS